MQQRLIEELSECRGGMARLKRIREEYQDKKGELLEEMDEINSLLEKIDEIVGPPEEKDAYQEASEAASEVLSEPVDSIGE